VLPVEGMRNQSTTAASSPADLWCTVYSGAEVVIHLSL
jgi:hypothetical protein